MPVRFTDEFARDQLGARLVALSEQMQRSLDQGHDGRIDVNDDMIGDIIAAAACVLLAEVVKPIM